MIGGRFLLHEKDQAMPTIIREDGSPVTDATEKDAIIHALRLTVARGTPPPSGALDAVLALRRIDDYLSRSVLQDSEPVIGGLYAGADVIALFPDTPELERLEALFRRPHRHSDAEIRYILAGEGVFGFVLPDGEQVEVTVEAGDLIGVPALAEHWFRLGPERMVIAVRLFGENPDWRADFTGTEVRVGQNWLSA